MTIAAFEATLMEYMDPEYALQNIPVLRMLFQAPKTIKIRAQKIMLQLRKQVTDAEIRLIQDSSKAGGGSLPDAEFETYAVALKPEHISVNDLEARLRESSPPVIARIKDNALILDARTIQGQDIRELVRIVSSALKQQ
jgi:L-seryl-tRNA(Ser) seleniumtransferase